MLDHGWASEPFWQLSIRLSVSHHQPKSSNRRHQGSDLFSWQTAFCTLSVPVHTVLKMLPRHHPLQPMTMAQLMHNLQQIFHSTFTHRSIVQNQWWVDARYCSCGLVLSPSTDLPSGTVCHQHYVRQICRRTPSSGHWKRISSHPSSDTESFSRLCRCL